ncbi:Sodium/hydrogen exchanger [Lophiostoma macrostomum CBS 122681]|uniref:Sodium/hydrogen exchanger n=1 Tax=Lophiostoma macrostomum CBS 122681 TaxID=1314788 RepID=A0A6A6T623_9PLEO|nr:Sodium/hydrogen exchanger [Lophiostoma macrostomum CBS 122681]
MATGTEGASSLAFHEPDIVTILVQTSFLLLLNAINALLDRLLFCGLLGQVLIGIAWGTPGAAWLPAQVEQVIVQLGYLGLILLVYEGGLSTRFKSLEANLSLSCAVALTGIAVPIALSFSLQRLLGATPLQAFAAGAALCSTSLGTTFTVLSASGLSSSRLGVVLTSAAMMDDVVGLVMLQVISNLGGDIKPIIIIRPILVSLAFAIIVPCLCRFLVKPVTLSLNHYRERHHSTKLGGILRRVETAFVLHSLLLIALVTGATYAGTSNLFAAYIAGATISWWDSEVPHPPDRENRLVGNLEERKTDDTATNSEPYPPTEHAPLPENLIQSQEPPVQTVERENVIPTPAAHTPTCGAAIYERYYQQATARILQPFFFASIGFSIPVTRMFSGHVVWRGLIYAMLMAAGKLVCGLWLFRFPLGSMTESLRGAMAQVKLPTMPHVWGKSTERQATTTNTSRQAPRPRTEEAAAAADNVPASSPRNTPPKPFSLYPPLIIALAMTARGEIGFLISAVAESNGVFSPTGSSVNQESDMFLVVTWAIVLCTIVGPLGVGLCVRRVRTLEERKNREHDGAGRDVLGKWAVG